MRERKYHTGGGVFGMIGERRVKNEQRFVYAYSFAFDRLATVLALQYIFFFLKRHKSSNR